MKNGIHPNYKHCTITCTTCGSVFESGSTAGDIKVDTCSNCHPFYTGSQRIVTSDGRIDRFNKRLAKIQAAKGNK